MNLEPEIFEFLKKLKKNNNRPWFKDNKSTFDIHNSNVKEYFSNFFDDGLKNILQRNKIILQIEIYEKNFKIVNDLILSFGYRLIFKVKERSNYFYINIK